MSYKQVTPRFVSIGTMVNGVYEERSERLPYKPSVDIVADGYCDTLANFVDEREQPITIPFKAMHTAASCDPGCMFTVLSAMVQLEQPDIVAADLPSKFFTVPVGVELHSGDTVAFDLIERDGEIELTNHRIIRAEDKPQ